ncbi:MAG: ATP-dependent Clp protease ATP-binding subunit ClpA [Bacteriovoracaceae bacterium]|jgi:ATP-dependent Clp protease ATP-binding subunit ClpA
MMSKKLELIINSAIKMANQKKHEYLTLESILFAMLDDEQVKEIIVSCGADAQAIKEELEQFLNNKDNFSILTDEQVDLLSRKQFVDDELRKLAADSGIIYQPEISLSLQRVIQRAAIHVQSSGKTDIRGINLLVAMFQEEESFALYLLQKAGIERFDVVRTISHGLDKAVTPSEPHDLIESEEGDQEETKEGSPNKPKKGKALEKFTLNLNELALNDKIDPLIGREEEIKRVVEILCRRRKNNPLLVGEAGVGKTALAEGLAFSIVKETVPEILLGTTVYSLDMASLLAGAKFRGDFEERLKNVLKELSDEKDQGKDNILFIDEFHTVMGAGATGGGSLDASNLLKPWLSSGKIRVMGSTTHDEFRKFVEKDPAFNRRFQKIDINEPSFDDTYNILKGLKTKFEEHHNVKYSNPVLKLAVSLGERYITDRKNPDKSIDIIDEAGASIQLLPKAKRRSTITKKDIETIVAKIAKIPRLSVAAEEKEKLKSLKSNLKLLIFGQDKAVDQVSDAILLSRSGLGNDGRPTGSFLFAGPTGVGKTELAKQLSIELGCHLERFDMSEYMEKHSVAKLIGAPPGYVGHDRGGLLTDAVKKNPHCVLLLDEIEKAHPDIYNVLLQVMDHGSLTDSHGRTTDFKNAIIIMTTNAGAKGFEEGSIGLASTTGSRESKRDKALKNFFAPEFRNRLDGIIQFNNLTEELVLLVADKFIIELETKLASKNVELIIDDEARKWIAKEGYDPKMGARPISRLIDNKIKRHLSNEVLFGKLSDGGKVIVGLEKDEDGENKLKFTF